jgi:hypothetical protein
MFHRNFNLRKYFLAALIFFALGTAAFILFGRDAVSPVEYSASPIISTIDPVPEPKPIIHLSPPIPTRGIYMTSCVAATPSFREQLVKLIEDTELNSIVIDIKDYSGTISFKSDNPLLESGGKGCVVDDMKEFVEELHNKNIYVIGRITVFQDPYYTKKRPDLAVKMADKKTVWKDYKGLSFIDPGAKEYWDYIVELSKESYKLGFDELNFDYVRFPSDGNMKNIYYTFSQDKLNADPSLGKAKVLREFFSYLQNNLKNTGAVLSVDLFGFVTTHTDDLNIGQILEYAIPYFDYICPMVYPSHYPKGYNNYSNPADHPYEIISLAMASSTQRLLAASSTPSKMRPWLQDFDLGADYTSEMIRKEKKAVYDNGLDSWLLWDPANKYTRGALD